MFCRFSQMCAVHKTCATSVWFAARFESPPEMFHSIQVKSLFPLGFNILKRCIPPQGGLSPVRYTQNDAASVPSDVMVPLDLEPLPRYNALDKVNEQTVEIINHIRPTLKKSFNLAAYVNVSDTLQQLLKLNVDLSKIDKYNNLASYIVRADFKADIEPYILFFLDNGVDIADVGNVLNRDPYLLMTPIEDLQVRVNYFLFRKFNKQEVASILVRAANIFNLNTKTIDQRLANFVKEYRLSSVELRHLVVRYPRVIQLNQMQIKKCTFMFQEELGFSPTEIKTILLNNPMIWKKFYDFTGHQDYVRIFDYVHHDMGIPHELIVKSPKIFRRRLPLIKGRHQYLKTLDRVQYDPTKPLYVPLSAFYEIDDSLFCLKYAKTSVNDFNAFLKSL